MNRRGQEEEIEEECEEPTVAAGTAASGQTGADLELETGASQLQTIIPRASESGQEAVEHDEELKGLVPPSPELEPAQQSCLSYGKNLVLLNTKYVTLFLGPDCTAISIIDICFIVTFIFFTAISCLIIYYIDHNTQNQWAHIVTKIVCIGHTLSYLAVALSDPGIARPLMQEKKPSKGRTIYCRKCRFHVPSRTVHCAYCDVCIEGYDHHCPWTSKCIGRNNLVRFYVFLFMTPIFIVYCAFAFGFTLPANQPHRQYLTTAGASLRN